MNKPLYIAFVDLTKAFDMVSRSGLLKLLVKIGCPSKLLSFIACFQENTRCTVRFNGAQSEPFEVRSGVKQGCVLAPTLFGIFFSRLLKFAHGDQNEGVYLHTRTSEKLFNLNILRAKTKLRKVLVRELLYADN